MLGAQSAADDGGGVNTLHRFRRADRHGEKARSRQMRGVLAPNFASVVKDFPAVQARTAHEARERRVPAVERFVLAMARAARPLVRFLDGLQ
jgi:hypothetical protein